MPLKYCWLKMNGFWMRTTSKVPVPKVTCRPRETFDKPWKDSLLALHPPRTKKEAQYHGSQLGTWKQYAPHPRAFRAASIPDHSIQGGSQQDPAWASNARSGEVILAQSRHGLAILWNDGCPWPDSAARALSPAPHQPFSASGLPDPLQKDSC